MPAEETPSVEQLSSEADRPQEVPKLVQPSRQIPRLGEERQVPAEETPSVEQLSNGAEQANQPGPSLAKRVICLIDKRGFNTAKSVPAPSLSVQTP